MKQRQSTRVAVLSKAMRIVDEDTRFEHNNRRILALEADNYQEQAVAAKDDEAFTLSDDEKGAPKKKRHKNSNQDRSKSSKTKWMAKPIKSLERILLDNGVSPDDANKEPMNYYSAAAKPSMYPSRRNFCSVCGYIANYSCVRCGSRYCSIKCNTNHTETRCMKFSI